MLWVGYLQEVSLHPATFDGYRRCGSRNIMVLFCHMTLQDDAIKLWSDFLSRSPTG